MELLACVSLSRVDELGQYALFRAVNVSCLFLLLKCVMCGVPDMPCSVLCSYFHVFTAY